MDLPGRFCGLGSRCGQSSSRSGAPARRAGRRADGPGREADRLLDTRHTGSVPGRAAIVTASSPAVPAGAAGCGCPGYHPGGGSTSATARRPGSSAPSVPRIRPGRHALRPGRHLRSCLRQRGDRLRPDHAGGPAPVPRRVVISAKAGHDMLCRWPAQAPVPLCRRSRRSTPTSGIPSQPGMPVRHSASQRRPVRSPVTNAAPEQAAAGSGQAERSADLRRPRWRRWTLTPRVPRPRR